jgi:micrococcal nuclease
MKIVSIVALTATLLITSAATQAKPINYGSATVSEVTSIYDGDTFRATIDGWPALIGKRISIRVNGVDTPEMRGKCDKEKALAREAKQHAVAMLRAGKVIALENMQRGKYFRIVADVYVDGESLSESLIRSGLGVTYHGKAKVKNWCE